MMLQATSDHPIAVDKLASDAYVSHGATLPL